MQVLIASTYNYLRETCLMFDICLDDHYFSVCLAPSWNHDISHPCSAQPSISLAYSVLILLVTSCYFRCLPLLVTFTFTTSILLLHFTFVASKYISGAVELTTQLSKLINTLWLPVCRIYKLGYSYPRRLSRSLTVEGYQVPFSGAVAGEYSNIYKST